jgi:hypothetical protein
MTVFDGIHSGHPKVPQKPLSVTNDRIGSLLSHPPLLGISMPNETNMMPCALLIKRS